MIVALTNEELQEAIDVVKAAGGHDALLRKLEKMKNYVVCSTITKRQASAWDAFSPGKRASAR